MNNSGISAFCIFLSVKLKPGNKRRWLYTSFIICATGSFFSVGSAQAQDTVMIEEVSIYESRFTSFSFSDPEVISEFRQNLNSFAGLEQVLSDQSSGSIKSYGASGGIATSSFRGAASNQSLVLWNGFPLNSGSTGIADLSLFRFNAFDEIKVIPGAGASLYGSGSNGGAVELNNNFRFQNKLEISSGIEFGSFQRFQSSTDIKLKGKLIDYRLSFQHLKAENDFPFYDSYKFHDSLEYRSNNAVTGYFLSQSFNIKISPSENIETGLLFHLKQKEIPNIAGSWLPGNQHQTDSLFKTYLRWNRLFKRGKLSAGTAFYDDFLRYTDKLMPEDSNYSVFSEMKTKSFHSDLSYQYSGRKLDVNVSGLFSNITLFTKNYSDSIVSESTLGLFTAFKYRINTTTFGLNLRYEWINHPLPIASFSGKKRFANNRSEFLFNISNAFRKPSFNEKYWLPGGNPDLKNESGLISDLKWKQKIKAFQTLNPMYSQSLFFSNMKNMIQWIPENGVWKAVNTSHVQTYGSEAMLSTLVAFNEMIVQTKLIAVWTSAKLLEENLQTQLIYTPYISGKVNLDLRYKKVAFGNTFTYTGKRFTTIDNNPEYTLKAFGLWNLYLNYEFEYKNFRFPLTLKCLNVTNTAYEEIKAFPSPGRSFCFDLQIVFKK
jgi:outer membrane cobalamin receptor